MKCCDFYAKTKSMLNVPMPNGSADFVYFGEAHPVVFHGNWDFSQISTLQVLQDLNGWETSNDYVEAHFFNRNGVKCVSLSSTSDPSFDSDVVDVKLTANAVYIEGSAH